MLVSTPEASCTTRRAALSAQEISPLASPLRKMTLHAALPGVLKRKASRAATSTRKVGTTLAQRCEGAAPAPAPINLPGP